MNHTKIFLHLTKAEKHLWKLSNIYNDYTNLTENDIPAMKYFITQIVNWITEIKSDIDKIENELK